MEGGGLKASPYVPGDLTDPQHRPPSYHELNHHRFLQPAPDPPKRYPLYRDDFSQTPPLEERGQNTMVTSPPPNARTSAKSNRILSPLISAISNFNLAKRLHKENLEHNPLPDTITDSIYRKLQMQRILGQDPGLSLDTEHFACGVGWKGYPGYGPNRCTKMKVFRPQTCALHPKKPREEDRPGSTGSFERKWRFIRQNKVNPIDLAICWDLDPVDPEDEPKPPVHIDGSNGSQAPAVFSLVHTPKEDESENVQKCDGVHGAEDWGLGRPKRSKSAHDPAKTLGSREARYVSTPNLCKPTSCTQHSCKKLAGRLCVACELKHLPGDRKVVKTEHKLAFKAGVPQKHVSKTWGRQANHVPKPTLPYRSRNYAIHSLAPPFSLQKHKRDDYPEHWRLATVYQHSYKPIYARKRSLLQTVYK